MGNTESVEIINLIFSLVFFLVLYRLFYSNMKLVPHSFILGIILVLLGNVFTVLEGFILPTLFNSIEHLSFTLGTLFFFLGALKAFLVHE